LVKKTDERVLGLQRLESATLARVEGILRTEDPHTQKNDCENNQHTDKKVLWEK